MRKFIDLVAGTASPKPVLKESNLLLLLEGKQYLDMLKPIEQIIAMLTPEEQKELDGGNNNPIQVMNMIKAAAKTLQRSDRQIWFTRNTRYILSLSLVDRLRSVLLKGDVEHHPAIDACMKLIDRWYDEYHRLVGEEFSIPRDAGSAWSTNVNRLWRALEHFMGVPYSKLQAYTFTNQSWARALAELAAIEQEFIDRTKGSTPHREGDQIILDCGDGYFWMLLNRASCRDEANAMGHCGNSPRSHTDDRILSLRKVKGNVEGQDFYEPFCTFILMSDGYLGEMKGKANQKPIPAYHPYIVELLKLPMIKGLRGGGYLPENNFSLRDLTAELRDELFDVRPDLMSLRDRIAKYGMTDEIVQFMGDGVKEMGRVKFAQTHHLYPEQLSDDDARVLFTAYPEIMLPANYYKMHGLTEEFINYIVTCSLSDPVPPSGHEDWIGKFGLGRQRHQRLLIDSLLTDEDRDALFDQHPELMTPAQHYKKLGLTDDLMQEIADGVESDGKDWLYHNDLNLDNLSDQERKTFFDKHPGLAPFSYRLKHHGLTEALKSDVIEKLDGNNSRWEDTSGEEPSLPIDGLGQARIIVTEWKTIDDLIEEMGDSALIELHSEGSDQVWENAYDNIDSSDLESLLDDVSIQIRQKIAERCNDYLRDEADDEEDVEELDHSDTSRMVEVLEENSDPVADALRSGVASGNETGALNEMHKAITDAISTYEWAAGHLEFTTYDRNGKQGWVWDSPVKLVADAATAMNAIDNPQTEDNENWRDYFVVEGSEMSASEPRYGYQDYDSEAALDRFLEECDIDTDDLEKNPYTPETMTDDEIRSAILTMREKVGGPIFYDEKEQFSNWDRKKISEVLKAYTDRYFGK